MPLRRKISFILPVLFLATVLFVPGAKALLLKTFLYTGLLNASAKKETIAAAANFNGLSFMNGKGEQINTADLKGKTVFINFWAAWCPPCIAEMGSVNALFNKVKRDPHIVFILADTDNNLQQSDAFMKKRNYDLPVYQLLSPIPDHLFTGTIPTTLIIDPQGNIVQRHAGIANYDTEEMVTF